MQQYENLICRLPWHRALWREEGQDLAEYAMLMALIALLCIALLANLGHMVRNLFNNVMMGFAANGL